MEKMPTLFIGHGSPMNAIEDNKFVREWQSLTERLPKPKAILSISAHWYTNGTKIMDEESPKTIYDMYGFPDELYKIIYAAKGSPNLAKNTRKLISRPVETDNSWGYDHGTWSVLHRMYPNADIPLIQLSVDKDATMQEHYDIGRQLAKLREEVYSFQDKLKKLGVNATVRKEFGTDIDAACGQLRAKKLGVIKND